MKNTLKSKTKIILSLVISVLLCTVFAFLSFSAADDFESTIAGFPESYKPYLRELHNQHPEWEFEPFYTGLDFNESVDNECGAKSLVSASVSSNIFKSKDAGDYDYSKGTYVQKDGGFVEANRLAVAYFLDPRNFLNADGIFMFETLSFNDAFTVQAVENVLKGSFMADAKINYYDSDGKLKKTSKKYSEVIFDAGKKYNVNPCYLASKILNEVGMSGSSSVSGTYKTYPGIYNFYNIGASDGSGAIARGLKWASTGTTYSRPWTSPEKSINGGAEYIAESYIACGQFTGYLQRFNVNPNGKHSVYTHQYMTNLTGALSQGYSTYVSYASTGLLENKYVFSIPVYENMPSDNIPAGKGRFADSAGQTGTVTAITTFVRTGPSVNYAKVLDNTGAEIKLGTGTPVTVLDKRDTDTNYYLSVLQYPYWCRISFVYNGVTYEGYVPESFVDTTAVVTVGTGEFIPAISVTDSNVRMRMISYDCNIAQITPDNKIIFLKEGTVDIAVYDSRGNFDKVKYIVSGVGPTTQTTVMLSDITPNTVTVNFNAVANATGYEIAVIDGSGNIIQSNVTSTASPYKVTGLEGAADYDICVRAIFDDPTLKKYGPFASSVLYTLPDITTVTKVSADASGNMVIHWNPLSRITGYEIFSFDSVTGTYTKIDNIAPSATSYTVASSLLPRNCFAVRAYEVVGEATLYGSYSKIVDARNLPAACTGVNVTSVTDSSYTMTWNAVDGVKYRIYKENADGTFEVFKSVANPTYKVKKAGLSAYARYRICAFKEFSGIVYEGKDSGVFSATTTPAPISGLKVSATSNGGKFTWKAVDNATCYVVYIYKENKKKYVKKTTVKTNSYTMDDKKPGKTYSIRIKACIKTTFGNYYGEPDTVTFYTKPEKVSDVKVSSIKTGSFKISWEKTGGTSIYYIYQYNSKKKKYVKVKETTGTSYSLSGLKSGTTYKFKVKSIKKVGGKSVSTNTSSVITTATKPSKVTGISAKRKKTYLKLSWPKVTGATNYQIYMYDSKKKKYVRLTSVEGVTEYKVKGLKAGKTYKFKIRPFKVLEGKNYFGAYSDVYSFKTKS